MPSVFTSPPAGNLSLLGRARENYLINPGFDFFQRQDPAAATARTDDTYGPDRWNILTQTASINCERLSPGGDRARNSARLTQSQAAAQRFGIEQIIESNMAIGLIGLTLRWQGRIRTSASQPIRFALLAWTGAADSVTSDVVLDWTSGVYTPGNFFLAASLTVIATGSITPAAATYTSFSIEGVVPAGTTNLIVFIWTEGTAAQNFTLDLTEMGLYEGSGARTWIPPMIQDDFADCQRYFQKSFNIDQNPISASMELPGSLFYFSLIATAVPHGFTLRYNTAMRTVPTITSFNVDAAGSAWRNKTLTANSGAFSLSGSGHAGFGFINAQVAGDTISDVMVIHYTADAEL
jgi:hypothetical protein